jgi:sugar phosphate isomerase/epimerase
MQPNFSLAHLTVLALSPPEVVRVASRTGYRYVGLRLIPTTATEKAHSLITDKAMLRETKAALADTGIEVLDVEFVQLRPETDVAALVPFLEVGAELGAKHVILSPYDPDIARLTDRFAAFCDLAAPYGLTANMEFFSWTVLNNISATAAMVTAAGRPNGGILVDALHFDRSDSTLAQLDENRRWFHFVHICDASGEKPTTDEGFIFTARQERLLPGDGGIDIVSMMRHMPQGIPVALEIPMNTLTAEIGAEEVARRAREAAARVLEAM